jgi:hypothetical protein
VFTSLGGSYTTIGEVWVTTKDSHTPQRLNFFDLFLNHKVGAKKLVVGVKVISNPHILFLWINLTTLMLLGNPG